MVCDLGEEIAAPLEVTKKPSRFAVTAPFLCFPCPGLWAIWNDCVQREEEFGMLCLHGFPVVPVSCLAGEGRVGGGCVHRDRGLGEQGELGGGHLPV